jgi:hypothetical protein
MCKARRLAALAVVLLGVPPAVADEGSLSAEFLARAREGVRQLTRDVEQLQDALVDDAPDAARRTAYRKLDAVRDRLDALEGRLKEGANRADLYAAFDEVDKQLGSVLDEVTSPTGGKGPLARAGRYVRASRDQLDYLLADGDNGAARTRAAVGRQARALAAATADLHRTAEFALDESPARDTLRADLLALQSAADDFATQAARGEAGGDLKAAFEPVATVWTKVIQGVRRLPPQAIHAFGRAASRVDQVHDRLYKLLKLDGDRPRLSVRT